MRAPRSSVQATTWWHAPKGKVNEQVISYVRAVENFQSWFYLKCLRLEALVDQNPRTNRLSMAGGNRPQGGDGTGRGRSIVTDNLVRQGIDTVTANVADADLSIRVQTDNADWSRQQNAKRLEQYSNAAMAYYDVVAKCQHGFRTGAALKGKAFNKVWIDQFDCVNVRPVPVENIVVDELECRDGKPRQLHYREFYDRELLAQEFPEFSLEIGKAQTMGDWRKWAGYRPFAHANEIVCIESWRLPIGPVDHPNHIPGRHTICIQGVDLLDEEYEDDYFPFSSMDWDRAVFGFYGHGLAEYILPHQTHLNRRNWQITSSLDKKANPIVWVHTADKNLSFKTFSQAGITAGAYKTQPPTSTDYQAVGQETYADVDRIRASAERETGINAMMASGQVPGGIESGEGVREVRKTHSQRFSIQQGNYEQYVVDTMWLVVAMCKKLPRDKVPDLVHTSKFGGSQARTLKWADINLDDLKYEMAVASAIANTPAGRQARVTELAQAGIVSLDEARELVAHPDIDRIISLYNAAIESVQWVIERIEAGETGITPEPYMNLQMCITMMQREYLLIQPQKGVPEEVLEGLSSFIDTAAGILNPPAPPQTQQPVMPGAPGMPPGPPGPMPPGAMPPMQLPAGAPVQAFNPNAYAPMQA